MELLPGKAWARGTDCYSHSHNHRHSHSHSHSHRHSLRHSHSYNHIHRHSHSHSHSYNHIHRHSHSHSHSHNHIHRHSHSHSHRRWIAPSASPSEPLSANTVLTTHAQTPHSANTGPSVRFFASSHNTFPSQFSSSSSSSSSSSLCRHFWPHGRAPMACRAEASAAVSSPGNLVGETGGAVSSEGNVVGGQWDGDLSTMAPLKSLHSNQWVKLICGASFEDVVDVRNMSLVYTLAGVDCIDCAAEAATVAATVEGVDAALELGSREGGGFPGVTRPWVMVSVSDDEDPHFRKAAFDPALCPADCPRPCERVCPTQAITFPASPPLGRGVLTGGHVLTTQEGQPLAGGVLTERCYGCGRCLPACPLRLIRTEPQLRRVEDLQTLLRTPAVDAIEIHTLPGHLAKFRELWASIGEQAGMLKLVAVSTPDQGPEMGEVLSQMYATMRPQLSPRCTVLWQLDGRPMSGDLGPATARAAVRLALKVLNTLGMPPGFIQLAGGTNECTYDAMRAAGIWGGVSEQRGDEEGEGGVHTSSALGRESEGLFPATGVSGVAFGGSARALVAPILRKLDARVEESLAVGGTQLTSARLEEHPDLLKEALDLAQRLLRPMKS